MCGFVDERGKISSIELKENFFIIFLVNERKADKNNNLRKYFFQLLPQRTFFYYEIRRSKELLRK